jgi:uncharacterized protein (TIGR02996 family)
MARKTGPPSRVPSPFPLEPFFRGLPGCEPFLQEIAERPWDDAIRLIFADWLEDRGKAERAELMRLQIQLAPIPAGARPARESQRVAQLERLVGWPDVLPGVRLERGLYTHAILDRSVFNEWARRRRQDVDKIGSLLRLVGEIRTSIDLQEVTIAIPLGRSWIERLVNSSELATITTLRLAGGGIDYDSVRALAGTTGLAHLKDLDLWGGGIEGDGARVLAAHRVAGQLRCLNLGANRLEDAGAAALAHSPAISDLLALDLMQNNITSQGAKELARGGALVNLTALNLFANKIDDAGARALAASPHLDRLNELDLRGNSISPAGQRAVRERWPFARTA